MKRDLRPNKKQRLHLSELFHKYGADTELYIEIVRYLDKQKWK